MRHEVSANCCRICLMKSKKLRSLYKPIDEGDEPPNEMLLKVTGITLEEMEKFSMLPKNICKNCELSLSMAYEFREKVLQSQETIVAYMQELQIPYLEEEAELEEPTNTKASQRDKRFKIVDNDLIEDQHLDESAEGNKTKAIQPERLFKQEVDDLIEVHHLDNSALAENIEMLDNKSDSSDLLQAMPEKCESDYDPQTQGTEEFSEEVLDDVETYEMDGDNGDSYNEEDDIQDEQYVELDNEQDDMVRVEKYTYDEENDEVEGHQHCDDELQQEFLSEKENTESSWNMIEEFESTTEIEIAEGHEKKVSRGRKSSKLPKKVSYICDICGNVYAKRGRMMEHRQRHDKQLKYSCELCDEKFHMRELLRKHMYSHSGGKPLKCQYCSRTFYYESVRKAHEAVHQGVKPYVCDVCGKPFSYSHSLKKHKLIHAEVKLYRCDYCNKDFRLQHHMKQHRMTRLHKKAVALAEGHYAMDSNNMSGDVDNDEELSEDVLMDDPEIEEEEHIIS